MTALAIIVIILLAGGARFYVKRRYNGEVERSKEAVRAAMNRNQTARVRNLHVANHK